jgi:hypothetical protein
MQTTRRLLFAVSDGSRRCHRTLKYFQGIAHKAWILNVDWARDCITVNKLLSPVNKSSVHSAGVINVVYTYSCYMQFRDSRFPPGVDEPASWRRLGWEHIGELLRTVHMQFLPRALHSKMKACCCVTDCRII